MGNPGGSLFNSFKDTSQIFAWRTLMRTLAQRYIGIYGLDHLRQWRFESWVGQSGGKEKKERRRIFCFRGRVDERTVLAIFVLRMIVTVVIRCLQNEPEGECPKQLTVGIDCDLASFLNYYDASAVGLREADAQLIFGGPARSVNASIHRRPHFLSFFFFFFSSIMAGSDGDPSFLYGLIDHCLHGKNFITGEPGCGRVDFLNAHEKGDSNAVGIITKELPVAQTVKKMLGNVSIPWGNDEGLFFKKKKEKKKKKKRENGRKGGNGIHQIKMKNKKTRTNKKKKKKWGKRKKCPRNMARR